MLGTNAILGPVVTLVAWTLVMMLWMYSVRFPAMWRKGISMKGRIGSRTGSLEGVVEDHVQWKAHNYNHLMEQPTLFYAVCVALALLGHGDGTALWLAWLYIAFRIGHSLIQATVNIVLWRFVLFVLASLCLAALTVQAAAILLRASG